MAVNRVALLGHPVAQSRSPQMQNAAFAAAGLGDWEYVALDVLDVVDAVEDLRAQGFRGMTFKAANSRYRPGETATDWTRTDLPRR